MLVAALLIATYRPCAAADPLFSAEPTWSGPVANTTAIALGDIDGDGRLDLVRGSSIGPSSVHRNAGIAFSPSSIWTGPEEGTTAIALGDVDGDGDLDLVRCNYDRGVTLYLGAAGTFGADTAWMGPPHQTIALADVDGDGDLDLVAADAYQPVATYANAGGTFSRTPALAGPGEPTQCLALGDVDGDGRLDLVRGNAFAGSTLHLNLGTGFDALAAWTGAPNTNAMVLADVNGDGRLDLVCGSAGGTTLYLNTGGTFGLTAAWTGPATDRVVLGDVDGDGDLDLVCSGVATEVYLNLGSVFDVSPAWVGPDEATRDIALADVDGDGDLDLIRGNYGQAVTFYRNRTPAFAAAPSWQGAVAHTHGVALGDIDGDGDVDLVRGNAAQPPTLDLNVAGIFQPAPWSPPSLNTFGVVLGDVDGDGRLDLVCGNQNAPASLFQNTGASFLSAPVPIGTAQRTWSVALGDVDGDGSPELVRGNQDQAASVYHNSGGAFDSVTLLAQRDTRGVAFGDVDDDGRLDLVRGNVQQSATLHRNVDGVLDVASNWTNPPETTNGIALGDVDGDGRVDLVRGNDGPNQTTLYLNSGGAFQAQPAWSGLVEPTTSVVLGDVNGDGRLDLVRGNRARPSTLYLNDGGLFAFAPAWTASSADSTRAVALGDVNGDGQLDLVCGNDGSGAGGSPTRAFWHRSPWIVDASGGSPRRQLTNGPAWLRWVRVVPVAANQYRISFQSFDAEADPVWLIGEYQFEGSDWHAMDLDGSVLRAGPYSTSASGVTHQATWNVGAIPFDRRSVTIRLRSVSLPGRTGVSQFIPSYLVNVGRVVPARAELVALPASLVFPTMTAGDTSRLDVRIENRGNLALTIQPLDVPDTAVSLEFTSLPSIPPDEAASMTVTLTPRGPVTLDPIHLHSNDPLRPVVDLPLVTDIRALAIETRLLTTAPELPLGEAATVVVTPKPDVHFDHGQLMFRPRIPNAPFEALPLIAQGANYVALIPGDRVTEAGLDYYVRVVNGVVEATDPPGAPAALLHADVAPPAGVTAVAQADSAGGYPVGRPTTVIVSLPRGTRFMSGTLFFRAGGAAVRDSVAVDSMELASGAHVAIVPGAMVGPRGVEYWARVRTQTQVLTDPADDPAAHPHVLRTHVSDLAEPAIHAGWRYRMLSIPIELGPPMPASLEAVLFDELGTLGPIRWRAFRYTGGANVELTTTPVGSELSPIPGRAFWLISRDSYRADTAPIVGRSTPTDAPFRIILEPGWNQIGDPFDFPVAAPVSAQGPSGTVSLEPPVGWDEAGAAYIHDVAVLMPFEGYFVKNPSPDPVEVLIDPIEVAPALTIATTDSSGWKIGIAAVVDGVADRRNVAGVAAGASDGADRFDRSEPPVAPGPAISLHFLANDGAPARGIDIRAVLPASGDASARGQRWPFDVSGEAPEGATRELALAFSGLDRVPSELGIRLIDRRLDRAIDLRAQPHYACAFESGAGGDAAHARFELQVGTEAFLDRSRAGGTSHSTRLLPVWPNPFGASAIVRFETARPGHVTLDVLDITGRRVRRLVDEDRAGGFHEVPWPEDRGGARLEPGVYLVRLATPDRVESRKVVKIQ